MVLTNIYHSFTKIGGLENVIKELCSKDLDKSKSKKKIEDSKCSKSSKKYICDNNEDINESSLSKTLLSQMVTMMNYYAMNMKKEMQQKAENNKNSKTT